MSLNSLEKTWFLMAADIAGTTCLPDAGIHTGRLESCGRKPSAENGRSRVPIRWDSTRPAGPASPLF